LETVHAEAGKTHYRGDFTGGVVQLRRAPPGGDFWFMDSGTSSEHIWFDRMNEILPKTGFAPQGTEIGSTNAQKTFDQAGLAIAAPLLRQNPYRILFARGYQIDAATITASAAQPNLQVQVWDRHADATDSAGVIAMNMMEFRL